MSQQLINRSPDLKRLRDEGYEIQIIGGYLLAYNIPYVNSDKVIKFGTLVSELTLSNNTLTARPKTHVINFIGEHPCNKDGSLITAIIHGSQNQTLFQGITINHMFSNKPPNGYDNYYHKISRYAEIISAPAKSMDKTVSEKTFKVIEDIDIETTFKYLDTNTSRAKIHEMNTRFNGQKIAIIGLGGTGAYILDLVAKTPVQQIHLFDGDKFLQHNAFRSPGAASIAQLEKQLEKVDYYAEIYSNMHRNIIAHPYYMNEETLTELNQMSYVFICVDKNGVRKIIMNYLLKMQIPFIDVGLGVNVAENNLVGTIRITTGTAEKNNHLSSRVSAVDGDDNEYNTNIQIADLNALNATFAVIKWKKMSGFYQDLKGEHHTSYSLNVSQLLNEDITA